jgi:hypothetical protein
MKVVDLLHMFSAGGVALTVKGEHLDVDAPAGVITPDCRAALKVHKPELLRIISWEWAYPGLPDAHYYAVVDADIARFGYYIGTREYPKTADSPETIWLHAALAGVAS